MAENAFLDLYKVLAEAPDPYPLLEAAIVRVTLHKFSTTQPLQDQAVKVEEAKDLERELQRYKEENAELKKRVNESAKAETKLEQMETKVRP